MARQSKSTRRTLVMELLAFVAAEHTAEHMRPLDEVDEREIRWVLEGGFGPLLYRAIRASGQPVPGRWSATLLGADLTAQVRHGDRVDTAKEVIDLCISEGVAVTLLKGISVSEQHYPSGHLRPMGDIDLLVPAEAHGAVQSALLARGYRPLSTSPAPGGAPRHHDSPLVCPERQVWVEVHRSLFDDRIAHGIFGTSHVTAQSRASVFHGRPVYRLAPAFQLLYVAYSCIQDMSLYVVNIDPTCLSSVVDTIYLLNASSDTLHFEPLLDWPDAELPIACLDVMLTWIVRQRLGVVPSEAIACLQRSQRIVGPLQRRLFHALLGHYLAGARRWNQPFPLPVPGRYSVRHQLRKRFAA
jgi:hypothetical protein